jgi:hypothetical protein
VESMRASPGTTRLLNPFKAGHGRGFRSPGCGSRAASLIAKCGFLGQARPPAQPKQTGLSCLVRKTETLDAYEDVCRRMDDARGLPDVDAANGSHLA